MSTYPSAHEKRRKKALSYSTKKGLHRSIPALLLLLTLLSVSGCQQPQETPEPTPTGALQESPAPTKAGIPTAAPTSAVTPEPTSALTPALTPEPTTAPTSAVTPEPTTAPTSAITPEPTEGPFPLVSPVPQEAVADIKGTLTKDTFPVVDGSTATIPLSEALYQFATGATAEEAAQAIIHTKTTNSYKRLYAGEVDLLIVYEPAEEIVERMQTEKLLMKQIGLDALVFMANTANPLESLTLEQLVSIYSGNVTNWSEVGGEEKELLAFQRPIGSGSQTLMQKLVMGETAMTDGDNVFHYSTMSDILEGMLSYIGEDNTLGYSVFYYANNMYYFPELKFMGVNGVLPSTQTIYDGSYPLTNAFYAVIRPDEPEDSAARKLFDWLTGAEGQQMVLNLGYVPVIMPEGGELITDRPAENTATEVTPAYSLPEGEHYVFFSPQNTELDYPYGDVIVYDYNWNVCTRFYNVVLPENIQGRYTNRYLPIGQIRQNTAGKQQVFYGIYDLAEGKYSVTPNYRDLQMLDAERGYYAVADEDDLYYEYYIVDGTGTCLLENIHMEDWLLINKQGNGYLEIIWDYSEADLGMTGSFYDENLKLRHAYYTVEAAMPPVEERLEGVGYHFIGDDGILIDENGTILISKELFLTRYGNGEAAECVFPFHSVTMSKDVPYFGIEYDGSVYIVDRNLELLRKEPIPVLPGFRSIQYYPDFYSCYDSGLQKTRYFRYTGKELTMQDGTLPDDVSISWKYDTYRLCQETEELLIIEKHRISGGEVSRYEYPLSHLTVNMTEVNFFNSRYVQLTDWTGRAIMMLSSPLQWNRITLYLEDKKIAEQEGTSAHALQLEDGKILWIVGSEEMLHLESDSLYETGYYVRYLYRYFVIDGDEVIFSIETPGYVQAASDGFLQIDIGNYTYVYDYNGNQFIKALNHTLGTD